MLILVFVEQAIKDGKFLGEQMAKREGFLKVQEAGAHLRQRGEGVRGAE
jgi:hypothetical protein